MKSCFKTLSIILLAVTVLAVLCACGSTGASDTPAPSPTLSVPTPVPTARPAPSPEPTPLPSPVVQSSSGSGVSTMTNYNIPPEIWDTVVYPDSDWWLDEPLTLYVKSSGGVAINLRSGPGRDYEKLDIVYECAKVTVLAEMGTYSLIIAPSNKVGWCSTGFLVEVYS